MKKDSLIPLSVVCLLCGAFLGFRLTNFTIRQLRAESKQLQLESIKNQPASVQWIIAHPQYADQVKNNYDTYMKAAQDAFEQTIATDSAKR